MRFIVPADRAAVVYRTPGSTVTIVNQTGTDVYFDSDPMRLNSTVAGAVPNGTKVAASGGQVQITNYPAAGYWFRAATLTTAEVQP